MLDKVKILEQEVEKVRNLENNKPLVVSIMGQTGVGKSSLINALFNTKLKTDSVKPCTKEINEVVINTIQANRQLVFYDLPGIGESEQADNKYLKVYLAQIKKSDILIWAIHSDLRSVTFDQRTLNNLLEQLPYEEKVEFISKITFVLTKVDLLTPAPWIFGKVSKSNGVFTISPEIQKLIDAKKNYYREIFIKPYSEFMVSTTYNDCKFNIDVEGFFFDEFTVGYKGIAEEKFFHEKKLKYPKFSNIFDRLNQNYNFISCSSLFRYNLNHLLLIALRTE